MVLVGEIRDFEFGRAPVAAITSRCDPHRESPLFMPVFHSDLRKSRIKSGENACIRACRCNIPKECTERVLIFRRKCSHFKEERWQQA